MYYSIHWFCKRTTNAPISLRLCAGWSGLAVSAYFNKGSFRALNTIWHCNNKFGCIQNNINAETQITLLFCETSWKILAMLIACNNLPVSADINPEYLFSSDPHKKHFLLLLHADIESSTYAFVVFLSGYTLKGANSVEMVAYLLKRGFFHQKKNLVRLGANVFRFDFSHFRLE